ncbi:Endonuclease V [Halomicrobium zhouii]|uniref:Endonuclease V n=1 Tax=Halomicrobium zhouii TaxID=767519 RepID=A0A1I6LGG9_9EURY|nr:endonuclease V [Halomicrobium zhouii]SFS02605.1 Endonuclease V [Halomicrobium zhouii]
MEVVRPEFLPDPALSREEMEALQRDIADQATFLDDFSFDAALVCEDDADQQRLGESTESADASAEPPLVAGVDQAFVDDRAVSAVVVSCGDEVVERVSAVVDTEIPYIPGLLSFREGGAIVAAFEALESEPDLALVDGSGRIHFREAGLATHVGLLFDLPAVGVAKSLLCGTPARSLDEKFAVGTRIPIEADAKVETADPGTVIGYALQTRQYANADRYVNPLYVSPGHRFSAATAADVVEGCCAGYKLPEPTRLADSYADEAKAELRE